MSLSAEVKASIIQQFGQNESDTGSPEVQVALLTHRIKTLTEHFKSHIHDNNSRRGMTRLVNCRRSLLQYLKKKDAQRYRQLIERLELRGN